MKTEHSNWDCQILIIWIAMLFFFIYFLFKRSLNFTHTRLADRKWQMSWNYKNT
jgi:hypothetical protein